MKNHTASQYSPGAAGPLIGSGADDLSWQDWAICPTVDPELFFPPKGGSPAEAKRVCWTCPVIDECLEYALSNDERFGVWGGLSEPERRNLTRELARPRPGVCPAGRHVMTVRNTEPDGGCKRCRREDAARDQLAENALISRNQAAQAA